MKITPVDPRDQQTRKAPAAQGERRTLGIRGPSRRTLGRFGNPSRRTLGRQGAPSRRTLGYKGPSRRTLGKYTP